MSNDDNSITKKLSEINFKMGKKLGEGMFSTVKLATHSLTNEQVAIKIIEKTKISKIEDKERINKEISIIKNVRHYNIGKLYAVVETKLNIYLIQEFIQGKEFMEYLTKKGKLKESDACKFFHQIISGLDYLHQCGIAHRDFKPENILLTNDNQILKIIDFGLSNTYKNGQLLKTACGSPCYVPPEMIKEEEYNGALADIWSAGVILYLMLCGNLPFYDDDNQILYEKILSGKYETPSHLSEKAKDILSKLLEVDVKKRINFEGIKSHPWFSLIDKKYLMHKGIIFNVDIPPIDEEILQKMEKMGFNKEEVRYNIIKNYHNKITTVYDLLLKRKIDIGQKSVADMNSDLYDEYIDDKKNKISYYGSLEKALKNRIGDDQKPVNNVPNWPENKYDNNNEEMIVGDSGSVIERLIKSGRFTYDEENMTINRVITRRPVLKKHISNDDDPKFKTVSSMQTNPKKYRTNQEMEIETHSPEINKRKKVLFQEEDKKTPKGKAEDEDWFKEMEELIDTENKKFHKVLRQSKTSDLKKSKKTKTSTVDDVSDLENETKKSLNDSTNIPKKFNKSTKNISEKNKQESKFASNNAKSMKNLKKNLRSTMTNETKITNKLMSNLNNKNFQSSKIKKNVQVIKKINENRPKSGKRKENSVERRGGKYRKIKEDINDSNENIKLRRNQSCERRLKIKI